MYKMYKRLLYQTFRYVITKVGSRRASAGERFPHWISPLRSKRPTQGRPFPLIQPSYCHLHNSTLFLFYLLQPPFCPVRVSMWQPFLKFYNCKTYQNTRIMPQRGGESILGGRCGTVGWAITWVTHHRRLLVQIPAAPLSIQLPTNVPGMAVEDGPVFGPPATHIVNSPSLNSRLLDLAWPSLSHWGVN